MSISFTKRKGMMRDKQKSTIRNSGNGVSGFSKERAMIELTRQADTNGVIQSTTHKKIIHKSRMSESHSQNTLKELKREGEVFVTYIYEYSERLEKKIVIGMKIVLPKVREWLKAALKLGSDLTSQFDAQLLFSLNDTRKSAKKPRTGVAMYRIYQWINMDTGEEVLKSKPEFVLQA